MVKKPPLGVIPFKIWVEKRINDLFLYSDRTDDDKIINKCYSEIVFLQFLIGD